MDFKVVTEKLLSAFNNAQVRHALMGGFALGIWGVHRATVDIDFLGARVKMEGTQFTIKNDGALTLHLVSLWVINSTNHERYDINVFVNSAATKNYNRFDVSIPTGSYTVKFVTERGNVAVFSGVGS